MKQDILTEALLRQFLLGKVDDQERERIESLFLTDSQARERVLAAEQDLVEDYLEDSLTAADKELFLECFGQTFAQRRQLQIKKSIKVWAVRESASTQVVPEKISGWAHLQQRLRLKPALVIPIVVTAMVVIVVVASWLSSRREQQAIEQELAHLNTPASLREVLPNMSPVDFSPVAVRSDAKETELKKTTAVQTFELRLPWTSENRYSSYRAEILRVDNAERFTIPPLLQAETDRASTIRLRLPARLLHRGHYKLRLSGINPDGSVGSTQEYVFAVSE
jgi:hypothetical protein